MDFKIVEAKRGLYWYTEAWKIFKVQIGLWLLFTLIYIGLFVVLVAIPLIGGLIISLIHPALIGGFYIAASEVEAGRPLDVKVLFWPLMDEKSRGPMLTLGAICIVFYLVSMLIMGGMAISTFAFLGSNSDIPYTQIMNAGFTTLVVLFALVLLQALFWMLMVYAIALVLFDGVGIVESLKLSLKACLGNWLALLIFGLILIPLSIIASTLMMIGWLFLIPIIMIIAYISYRDIFKGQAVTAR